MDDACGFICSYLAPEGDEEAECLERFSSGDYRPSLLLPDEGMAAAALASPEALWKLRNLRKMG